MAYYIATHAIDHVCHRYSISIYF